MRKYFLSSFVWTHSFLSGITQNGEGFHSSTRMRAVAQASYVAGLRPGMGRIGCARYSADGQANPIDRRKRSTTSIDPMIHTREGATGPQ